MPALQLFIHHNLNRIDAGGAPSWVESSDQAAADGDGDGG